MRNVARPNLVRGCADSVSGRTTDFEAASAVVADGLDVVPVGVEDEGAVVAGVVAAAHRAGRCRGSRPRARRGGTRPPSRCPKRRRRDERSRSGLPRRARDCLPAGRGRPTDYRPPRPPRPTRRVRVVPAPSRRSGARLRDRAPGGPTWSIIPPPVSKPWWTASMLLPVRVEDERAVVPLVVGRPRAGRSVVAVPSPGRGAPERIALGRATRPRARCVPAA